MNINDIENSFETETKVIITMEGSNYPPQFDIVFYDRLGENRAFTVFIDEMYFQGARLFLGTSIGILDEEFQRNYQFRSPSPIRGVDAKSVIEDFSSFVTECLMDILDEIGEMEYNVDAFYLSVSKQIKKQFMNDMRFWAE